MTSRRKFVLKSSLAAIALMAARPMNLLASTAARFQKLAGTGRKLVLMHTGKISTASFQNNTRSIINNAAANGNVLLMNVGGADHSDIDYDLVLHEMKSRSTEYLVVTRNGLRTGLIVAANDEGDICGRVDKLAGLLKSERDCQLVVCVSSLGYRNRNSLDDRTLAATTSQLDVIITAHASNFHPSLLTVRNKVRGEVIIQSSQNRQGPVAAMELQFDDAGKKNGVALVKGLPGSYAA